MKRHVLLGPGVLLVGGATATLILTLQRDPSVVGTAPASGVPARLTLGRPVEPPVGDATESAQESQWGRVQINGNPERTPPHRADWSDDPQNWELLPVGVVTQIPPGVREVLEPLDCAIPRYRPGTIEDSVAWGEFERSGQRDLAVLCVHEDKTSATYVFWRGDPSQREVMPTSGSGINVDPRERVQQRMDPGSPLEPDMPVTVEHDGLEIGCCECCSTIYYRHGGQWFTLPGAD